MHREELSTASRRKKNKSTIWQRRYWEHRVRSEKDFKHHMDYIHYNPVKHGMVESPRDYSLSSFERFAQAGQYEWDWRAEEDGFGDHEFGE